MTTSDDLPNPFTPEQREFLAKGLELAGESWDKRVQWFAQCMLFYSDRLSETDLEVLALRRLLARHALLSEEKIQKEIDDIKARNEVEKERGKDAAVHVKHSEYRDTLRRLLGEIP